jgi:DNA primase
VVYNLHRAGESDWVVVVEGFFDCMKVAQAGYPAVALMGSSLAEQQEILLLRQFEKVTLMLDGDAAGREAVQTIAQRLVRRLYVRIVELADGQQPDHLSEDQLRGLLG